MRASTAIFLVALLVLIAGRFHWVFRDRSERGDFPTHVSFWVRIGSVIVFNILCIVAIILTIRK